MVNVTEGRTTMRHRAGLSDPTVAYAAGVGATILGIAGIVATTFIAVEHDEDLPVALLVFGAPGLAALATATWLFLDPPAVEQPGATTVWKIE
jgi:hypothetical protein